MDFKTFDRLVERETKRMKDVMCSKSADYSAADDKLFNFKLAAELDGVSPIEALRGMWLKHRTSIRQGLDELVEGKPCRSKEWWIEKLTDDRNYSILLQALLEEKYFNNEPEEVGEFTIIKAQDTCKGWYIILTKTRRTIAPRFLQKDLEVHTRTDWDNSYAYGCAPGYYGSKEYAKKRIQAYKNKQFVCPEGWKIADAIHNYDCGWYIFNNYANKHLHKDFQLHGSTGYCGENRGEAPGYWPTKEEAEAALAAYLRKQEC